MVATLGSKRLWFLMLLLFLFSKISLEKFAGQIAPAVSEGDRETQHESAENNRKGSGHGLASNADLLERHGYCERPDYEPDGPAQNFGGGVSGVNRRKECCPGKEIRYDQTEKQDQDGDEYGRQKEK